MIGKEALDASPKSPVAGEYVSFRRFFLFGVHYFDLNFVVTIFRLIKNPLFTSNFTQYNVNIYAIYIYIKYPLNTIYMHDLFVHLIGPLLIDTFKK